MSDGREMVVCCSAFRNVGSVLVMEGVAGMFAMKASREGSLSGNGSRR